MEMLRTIIVALIFAGVTVCTYYYLNSSQFPWEIANPGENVAQTSGNPMENALPAPTLNDSGPSTFAQDGPFTPASMNEGDDLSLPGLDELPEALESNPAAGLPENGPAANPMVMASDPHSSQPPVLDTDLPALSDGTNTPPDPVQANHEKQIGSKASVDSTHALPAPDEDQNLDLPPGPDFDTTPRMDVPPVRPAAPYSNPSTGGVTNPLRTNPSPVNSSERIPSPDVSSSPSPVIPPCPPLTPPEPVQKEEKSDPIFPPNYNTAKGEIDSAAIREYLKKANEKIQAGHALEVLRELSKFYGNSRFSAEESSELVDILVLAAREVIYSQKSFRDPPYTIQAGDTLEKIAAEYQIPQEFLILVNGLQRGVPLQPGTQLKVIRGPFHALVYLDRHEMLLTLDGLFAGRFWIGIGNELIQKNSDFSYAGNSVIPNGTDSIPCCDFTKIVGEPGCAESLKIQACTDENAIGNSAPSGTILMSRNDVQSLGAILGPKSELLLRCHSHEQKGSESASASAPAPTPAPAPEFTPNPTPATAPDPAPAYGSSAELPNSLPNSLPDTLPGTGPELAPTADELPLELPETL